MRPLSRSTALCALLLVPGSAFAWSHNEHSAIALVAQDLLAQKNSPALTAAQAILGPGATLDAIAPCADQIRHATPGGPSSVSCGGLSLPMRPDSAHWHFVDAPVNYGSIDGPSGLDAYCPGGDCVVQAIRNQVAALQGAGGDKRVALMFLVHLVGDAHQPLHCSTEYQLDSGGNPQRDPKRPGQMLNDGGGNAKPVTMPGTSPKYPPELHSLWDQDIEVTDSVAPRDIADGIEADLKGRDTGSWTSGDFVQSAAYESFTTARDVIYPSYHADVGSDGKFVVTPAYQAQMKAVALQRMEMAGVRLAALLEQALSPKTGSAPAQAQGAGPAKPVSVPPAW